MILRSVQQLRSHEKEVSVCLEVCLQSARMLGQVMWSLEAMKQNGYQRAIETAPELTMEVH